MKEDHSEKQVKPLHYLAAPGLPTISQHMAQRIWNLEFIEMEEFFPSNKTMQVLERSEGLRSLSGGSIAFKYYSTFAFTWRLS